MKRNQFIEYIEQPEKLNEQSLSELKSVVEEFPYFQAARMLLVKNLHILDDIGFNNELKITAAHISDRKKLFFLLNNYDFLSNPDEFEIEPEILEKKQEQKNISLQEALFDYERGNINYDVNKVPIHYLVDEPLQNNSKMSLIDNFLTKQNVEKIRINKNENVENEDFSIKSLQESDDLMTETLANILIKQKNFSKAKNIFERLCLKYPEKSIYFAARIKEIDDIN